MDRKEEFLKPGERLDDLQNGYWMIQNPSLFCYGIDAVLLASYAKVKRGERASTDSIALCLLFFLYT